MDKKIKISKTKVKLETKRLSNALLLSLVLGVLSYVGAILYYQPDKYNGYDATKFSSPQYPDGFSDDWYSKKHGFNFGSYSNEKIAINTMLAERRAIAYKLIGQ